MGIQPMIMTACLLLLCDPAGAQIQPPEAVEVGNRPIEVRLRILADRLAAGLQKLPGQGRYERIMVARFAESGAEVKKTELGALIAAQLSTFLRRDHAFFLVERDRMIDLVKEIELSMTGLLDPGKAAEIGKMAGAQAVVVGNVSEAGADFVVSARLVSVETASVLVAESVNLPRLGMVALAEESVVLRTKSGALFRSLVAPGWGQFYNRQPLKGGIILGAEAVLVGVAVALHVLGASDESAYHDSNFALRYPDSTSAELAAKAQALRSSAEDYYQARNIVAYCAIGAWLYNILDAYLFGIDGEREAGLTVFPTPSPGIGLAFGF